MTLCAALTHSHGIGQWYEIHFVAREQDTKNDGLYRVSEPQTHSFMHACTRAHTVRIESGVLGAAYEEQ